MNELLTIKYNEEQPTVSARELHIVLNINTRFNDWFRRMAEYGFEETKDFYSVLSKTSGRPSIDYQITIDMAKEICMIQRTPEGKQIRQYFIELEKAWNSPEQVFARALKMADKTIQRLQHHNTILIEENARMKPKEVFADAVRANAGSILVRGLAKMIAQNGIPMGEKRLYQWLRERGNNTLLTNSYKRRGIMKNEKYLDKFTKITKEITEICRGNKKYSVERYADKSGGKRVCTLVKDVGIEDKNLLILSIDKEMDKKTQKERCKMVKKLLNEIKRENGIKVLDDEMWNLLLVPILFFTSLCTLFGSTMLSLAGYNGAGTFWMLISVMAIMAMAVAAYQVAHKEKKK